MLVRGEVCFFFEVESRKFTMNQNVDIANGVYNLLQSLLEPFENLFKAQFSLKAAI